MNTSGVRTTAIVLMVAGVLVLIYGGFSYPWGQSHVELGPMSSTMQVQRHVYIPIWVGVISVAIGGALLLTQGRKS